jgi:hypothetical protein
MSKETEPKPQDEIESARIGYEVATNLWIYEGETFWSKFNSLLVANSIILGSIVLLMTVTDRLRILNLGMPIIGIILCFVWSIITRRGLEYYRYWIFSAREIEERFLKGSVQTVSRGGDFADGKEVEIKIGDKNKPFKMSRYGRLLKVERTSYLIITLFAVLYLALLFVNISSLVKIDP